MAAQHQRTGGLTAPPARAGCARQSVPGGAHLCEEANTKQMSGLPQLHRLATRPACNSRARQRTLRQGEAAGQPGAASVTSQLPGPSAGLAASLAPKRWNSAASAHRPLAAGCGALLGLGKLGGQYRRLLLAVCAPVRGPHQVGDLRQSGTGVTRAHPDERDGRRPAPTLQQVPTRARVPRLAQLARDRVCQSQLARHLRRSSRGKWSNEGLPSVSGASRPPACPA